jgi:hypothetical protein
LGATPSVIKATIGIMRNSKAKIPQVLRTSDVNLHSLANQILKDSETFQFDFAGSVHEVSERFKDGICDAVSSYSQMPLNTQKGKAIKHLFLNARESMFCMHLMGLV